MPCLVSIVSKLERTIMSLVFKLEIGVFQAHLASIISRNVDPIEVLSA